MVSPLRALHSLAVSFRHAWLSVYPTTRLLSTISPLLRRKTPYGGGDRSATAVNKDASHP